ncbi:MAG: S8 family serine peptidase [Kineosporiaceae bacterium]
MEFLPGRGVAFRPGEVLVNPREDDPGRETDRAATLLTRAFRCGLREPGDGDRAQRSVRLAGDLDLPVPAAVRVLRAAGIDAHPNHLVFADCCGPHPVWAAAAVTGNPFSGNPFSGNPFSGNPFSGNPFSGNPFSGNPGGAWGNPAVHQDPGAYADSRRNLARPVDLDLGAPPAPAPDGPRVAVLDVALLGPDSPYRPDYLRGVDAVRTSSDPGRGGLPDLDRDGFLDKAAGHGMFVAGIITRTCPQARVTVIEALSNEGVGDELTIVRQLEALVGRYDIVNLSFSSYALEDMPVLAEAVLSVQLGRSLRASGDDPGREAVVVASAGNDATCHAPYPAGLPNVVSVAALGPHGPAPFTNYGPWVRACAAGVDVPSTFFRGFQGALPAGPDGDPDTFRGAAAWSGTSFAAPLVAGKIAQVMQAEGLSARQAVARVVDAPGLARLPMLGTVVTA